MLIWNIICILLLLNVVSSAVPSLPARFQEHGFEQQNIGLRYFPFLLLPASLVPMALFANLAAIRLLFIRKDKIDNETMAGDQNLHLFFYDKI